MQSFSLIGGNKMITNFLLSSYIVICVILLSYSYIYTYKSKVIKEKIAKMELEWKVLLDYEFENLKNNQPVSQKYLRCIERRLLSINSCISYLKALNYFKEHPLMSVYLRETALSKQYLVYKYYKKDDMNKSFLAYVLSLYPPHIGNDYLPILEMLIKYIDDASVSCRENALRALYAIGNVYAVERAFQFMNDHHIVHHPKLLADGLTIFRGNKDELMKCLWKHIDEWDTSLIIAIVKFISFNSSEYTSVFLPYLTDESVDLEIRIEILRYYRKYYYEPVKETLYSFFNNNVNVNLSIVSASVLAMYPSQRTLDVLKKALCHSNWYVRYNAAESLLKMNMSRYEINDILYGNDQYAKDILTYMMEQEGN